MSDKDKKRISEDDLGSAMENQELKRLRSEKNKIPKFHYMEHYEYEAIVNTVGPLGSDSTGTGIK